MVDSTVVDSTVVGSSVVASSVVGAVVDSTGVGSSVVVSSVVDSFVDGKSARLVSEVVSVSTVFEGCVVLSLILTSPEFAHETVENTSEHVSTNSRIRIFT